MRYFLLPIMLLFVGCQREDIQVYQAPKDDMASSLRWNVPADWTELPASSMRVASFQGPDNVDISVVVFPGEAGGALANVNRWRGQIGLEPTQEADLTQESSLLRTQAGTARVVDLKGSRRILGAIISHQGKSWFFKAIGSASAVETLKPTFIQFLKSVRER